jgi:DNA-binding PadR family transcriptional regulator
VSVAPDELTGTKQAVLLVLMSEARPVRNPELATLGPELKKLDRDELVSRGLIEVTTENRAMVLELTDRGWAACAAIIGADVPPQSKGQGKAMYTVLRALRRYLDRADLAPADLFVEVDDTVDVEAQVRATYVRLAARSGGWVDLVRLRAELPEVSKHELDEALTRMHRAPDVTLLPEENQKTLTPADHAAAVEIGNQARHLIAIES